MSALFYLEYELMPATKTPMYNKPMRIFIYVYYSIKIEPRQIY